MSKKIDWSQTFKPAIPDITSGKGAQSTYRNMKERFQKAHEELQVQEKIQSEFAEKLPMLKSLLAVRLSERTPLKVMRPLVYTTEALGGADEEDDGFYNMNKSQENAKFQSVRKQIPVGTELTFMNLEKSLNQLWFRTNEGEEVGIYLEEQQNLMTQTDIYESVCKFLGEQE